MPETLILQSTIDLSTPSSPSGQFAIAAALLLIAAGIIVAVRYRSRYAGLPETNARHKASLNGSKRDQTPRSMYVGRTEYVGDLEDEFRSLFDRRGSFDSDRATFLEAAGSMRLAMRHSMRPLTDRVSRMVIRLVSLAWLVAVFGAMAVSTEAVIYYLGGTLTIDDFYDAFDVVVELTTDLFVTGDRLIAGFPYGGEVWALAFTLGLTIWEWAYLNWPIVAGLLALLAGAIAGIEQQLEDDVETRLYDRWIRLYTLTIGAATLVWLAGVLPATVGNFIGLDGAGRLVGITAAFLVAITISTVAIRGYVERLRSTARDARDRTALVRGYLVFRRAGLLAGVPASVLVLAYLVVLAITDKFDRILAAYLAADLSVQLGIAIVPLAVLVGMLYLLRESWLDVQQAVRDNWSRTRVRGVLLSRGVPFIGIAVGYLVAYSFTQDILLGTIIAIFGGLIAYLLWGAIERAKYRFDLRPRRRRRPADVLVQGYRLEDADGNTHPFAVVNGRIELAREDVDDLVDDVTDAIFAAQTGERVPPTIGSWHARSLLEYGMIDEADSWSSARERARKTIMNELRPIGSPIDRDDLERAGERIPRSAWEDVYDDLASDVLIERGESVELLSDPWAEERREAGLSSFWTSA